MSYWAGDLVSNDLWAVVPEADREQWDYIPFVQVGPLRFGMSHDDPVAAMRGFPASKSAVHRQAGVIATLVAFRAASTPSWKVDVKAYCSQADGLYCVAVNALRGPQVTLDGLRLIGRPPSELNAEIEAYTDERGIGLMVAGNGDFGADEFGYIPGAADHPIMVCMCSAFTEMLSGWTGKAHRPTIAADSTDRTS